MTFLERLHALIERRAAEALLEIAILAKRARRSIGQRTRRDIERIWLG